MSESTDCSLSEGDIEKLIASSEKLKIENYSLNRENQAKTQLSMVRESMAIEAKRALSQLLRPEVKSRLGHFRT